MSLPAAGIPSTIPSVNQAAAEESAQPPRPEYDNEVAHTIWELERGVRRGYGGEATRLALLKAHVEHMRLFETRIDIPEAGRSFLRLQDRSAPSVLVLAGESQDCSGLQTLGSRLHRAGFGVLASSLAYRSLDRPGLSPFYWQTCLDEAENRYDMLNHYATRIAVIGFGLGAAIALHLATRKRVNAVVGVFPILDAKLGATDQLRTMMRNLAPRLFKTPPKWTMQRRLATAGVQKATSQFGAPILVLVEERSQKGDAGRSLRFVKQLTERGGAQLQTVPAGAADALPDATIDTMLAFLKQR